MRVAQCAMIQRTCKKEKAHSLLDAPPPGPSFGCRDGRRGVGLDEGKGGRWGGNTGKEIPDDERHDLLN